MNDPNYQIYFDAQTTGRRAGAVKQAAKAGKHVYCEKPIAADTATALELYKVCEEAGMALPAGESASVRYIIHPRPPVKAIAALSGSVSGIVVPKERLVTGKKLTAGDVIIGASSSGLHANGVSLVIEKALALPEQFLTKLPNGKTLGEEALTPARSYVALVEALLENEVDIHALLPGTGDGVGKIAFDKRPFTYRIRNWPKVPELFRYYDDELNVSSQDCLKTFNWGVGYYISRRRRKRSASRRSARTPGTR